LSWTLSALGLTVKAHLLAHGVATVIRDGVRFLPSASSLTTWMMLSLIRFRRTTLAAPVSGLTSMPVPVCWKVPA